MAGKVKNKNKKGRKQSARSQATEAITNRGILEYLPFICLTAAAVLIFYPPFFQGLFFPKEMFITHVLTGIILFLVVVKKWQQRDLVFLGTPLDWAAAVFTLAYLISLIGAVHPGEAWYGFLKVLNYFAVYLIISNVIRNIADAEALARVLVASGVGVAVIGIMAALGYSDYPAAFQAGAIYSTLQYSNTTAAFLAVMSLIAAGLWTREKDRATKFVYLLAIAIMILTVLATFSKGAWLIYGAGTVLMMIGMPGVYRLKAIYGLLTASVAAAAAFQKFYPAVTSESSFAAKYLLICAAIVLAAFILWEVLEYLYRLRGTIVIVLGTILLLVLILISLEVVGDKLFTEQNITQELSGLLDFENSSYVYRMDLNRWAWEIVKDYPINGTGAGGWNALYHQYQDYLLWTTEVHNHFLQVWIEGGTIGFLAWMLIIAAFIYSLVLIKQKKANSNEWILYWGLACASFALLSHSLIDFDLSIPSMAIVYWAMIAAVNRGYIIKPSFQKFAYYQRLLTNAIITLISVTLFLTGLLYWSAINYSEKGYAAMEKMVIGSLPGQDSNLYLSALINYQKAAALDSQNARYKAELAYLGAVHFKLLSHDKSTERQVIGQQVLEQIEEARRMAPHDTIVYNRLIEAAALMGDPEVTRQLAVQRVKSNPLDITTYNLLAEVLWKGMQAYLDVGEYQAARYYAEELIDVEKKIEDQNKLINSKHGKKLILSEDIRHKIDEARNYLNNI